MEAMVTRRNFMRGAGIAALAGCGVMLTGCGIVDSIIDSAISKAYDDDIKLGKYTVAGADASRGTYHYIETDNGDEVVDATLIISFNVNDAADLKGKDSASFISDITIDGTPVTSLKNSETAEVDSETIFGSTVSAAFIEASYNITGEQYYAFFENGKELKFTVTMPDAGSAEYILTYDKSKEGTDSDPITSKPKEKA